MTEYKKTSGENKPGEDLAKKRKTYVRPEILSVERLESVANVCGPPGFGKTTPTQPDLCNSGAIKS